MCASYMQDTIENALHVLMHVIYSIILRERYDYLHFTGEKTEA